ncbi:MAG: hypothetical protein GY754_11810 [bacterium]|nr:hypothetical protein [bacterium]
MTKKELTEEDIKSIAPSEKIGLVATKNSEGNPHISLITSIQANGPEQLIMGEFCKGESKKNIRENREIGFLIMTLDRKLRRGRARWTHSQKEGPEFEMYNNQPMFRYNTYFGVNTVHFLDLVEISEAEPLPLGKIARSLIKTRLAAGALKTGKTPEILNPFSRELINKPAALKFIAYIDDSGFPAIIPLLQCTAPGSGRLAFAAGPYSEELLKIPKGKETAVYGLTMEMENVLIRGTFSGFTRKRLINLGCIDINRVYNSMPPAHGWIYPETKLEPVTEF